MIRYCLPLLLAMITAAPGFAAELIMFERDGCIWCQRWLKEVGPIYPKTPEGARAPLRVINLDRKPGRDGLHLASPIRYTPTFVLVHEGREIGRLTGYINDDTFWGLLGMELKRVPGSVSRGN